MTESIKIFKAEIHFFSVIQLDDGFPYGVSTTMEHIIPSKNRSLSLAETLNIIENGLNKKSHFTIINEKVEKIIIYESKRQENSPNSDFILFFQWVANKKPPLTCNTLDIMEAYEKQRDKEGYFNNAD